MKIISLLFPLTAIALAAQTGKTPAGPTDLQITTDGTGIISSSLTQDLNLVFACGRGLVQISLKDGSVTYQDGAKPDEAGVAFWKMVQIAFPDALKAAVQAHQRAYTVEEIDALRIECEQRWLHDPEGPYGSMVTRFSYSPQEEAVGVEQMVRTQMTAAVTAEDMKREDREADEKLAKIIADAKKREQERDSKKQALP